MRLSVSAELVEKEGEIIFYARDVPFMARALEVISGGRVFEYGPVRVVGAAFGLPQKVKGCG